MAKISIVDVGTGNIKSIEKAFRAVGAEVVVATEARQVAAADKLVLPGVGHFDAAMVRLRQLGFDDALHECALTRARPVLGICLGMHLMASRSEEGSCPGLGWVPEASVVRFRPAQVNRCKVPHIGWNDIQSDGSGRLLRGIAAASECYFSHSFHLKGVRQDRVTATTTYSYDFASVVEHENLFGVQFHPEKSRSAGNIILNNFASL